MFKNFDKIYEPIVSTVSPSIHSFSHFVTSRGIKQHFVAILEASICFYRDP